MIQLARKFEISEVKASLTKQDNKKILVQYLVDKDILEESALISVSKSASDSDVKLKELELKLKMELRVKEAGITKSNRRERETITV